MWIGICSAADTRLRTIKPTKSFGRRLCICWILATQALSLLTDSSRSAANVSELTELSFTPDSKIILVTIETCQGACLGVHLRGSWQYLLQLQPPACNVTVACLGNTRAAIATRTAGLTVCGLLNSTLLSSKGWREAGLHFHLGELALEAPMFPSLLSTDPTESKLAYIAADSTVVQIFDAVTLQHLGSFSLSACLLQRDGSMCGICGLDLGTYSCSLSTCLRMDSTSIAFVCRLDAGFRLLSQPLRFQSTQAPALSSVGVFGACVSKSKPSTVQVYNIYSGAMVLAHEVTLPSGYAALGPLEVAWMGSKLLITTNAIRTKSQKPTDHILVLHL